MRNKEMARDYVMRAKRCLREAALALEEDDPPGAVRRSQEALELAVKALLRLIAVEYPREHDVSDVLLENVEKIPEELRSHVQQIAELMAELAAVRGPAFYGYEREGIPASEAFTRGYSEDVYEKVRRYVTLIMTSMGKYL